MKTLLLISSILMASCYFGEVEGIPEATKLSITNNTAFVLYDVKCLGTEFGEIEPGDFVVKQVVKINEDGNCFIRFSSSGTSYQVREPVRKIKLFESGDVKFNNQTLLNTPIGCTGNCSTIQDVANF